jgi:tetratricopeptide (TPR) repeat protein
MIDQRAEMQKTSQVLVKYEYENIYNALLIALQKQTTIIDPYRVLSIYLERVQDSRRNIELGEMVLNGLESYSSDNLSPHAQAEIVSVIDYIANIQLRLRQYKSAKRSYQKALLLNQNLTLFEESQKEKLSAGIYLQLGQVDEEEQQFDEAMSYYQKALSIFVEFSDYEGQGMVYHHRGQIAHKQRQWMEAERCYQRAISIFIKLHSETNLAKTYLALGNVVREQQRLEKAERYYIQALVIFTKFNDRDNQATAYRFLGRLFQSQQQWEKAESNYEQALRIFIESNNHYEQAGTYHQLGRIAEGQQHYIQAREYFVKAVQIYANYNHHYDLDVNNHHDLDVVLFSLVRLYNTNYDPLIPASVAAILGGTEEEVAETFRL